ncbi:hypothetical protein [Chryseolinea soli]|nr:hypothetical protein [Chryseolinea soli]
MLSACVFDADEEYFKDLAKPDPSTVGGSITIVDLGNYNPGDTIDLFGSTTFNFSLSGTHGKVESATLSLDGEKVSNGTTGSFTMEKRQLSDGTFALTLELITGSGTGSLAEAVGSEKFKITLKWIARVDLSPPLQPVPTLDIVDGFLTVQWPAYTKPNFQSYLITRELPSGATQSFEIKDKQTVSWRDESYAGGLAAPVTYTVSVVSEIGKVTSAPIDRVDPIDFRFSFNTSDSTFTYKWKPTKLYGTFKGYEFAHSGGKDITVLTDVNDSTFTDKLSSIRFGEEAVVGFVVRSKAEGFPAYSTWSTCKLGKPLPFAAVGKIRFNAYLNRLVAVDADNNLVELNEQFQPVRTIATLRSTSWRMPYPGNYVYSTTAAFAADNIFRLKLEDGSEASYEYDYLDSSPYSVASNGLICIDYDRPPIHLPSGDKPPLYVTRAVDPAGGTSVFAESSTTTKLSAVISEDGRYIWANNNRVFKISGGTSQLIGSFSGPGTFIGFRQDNSDEMMFRDGNQIKFYDTNTFALIRSINPPVSTFSWNGLYDVRTKNMFWTRNAPPSNPYTVNIETGVTRAIPVADNAAPGDFYMIGDILIYRGNYIQVK